MVSIAAVAAISAAATSAGVGLSTPHHTKIASGMSEAMAVTSKAMSDAYETSSVKTGEPEPLVTKTCGAVVAVVVVLRPVIFACIHSGP